MGYQKADGNWDFSSLYSAHNNPGSMGSYVWPANMPPSGSTSNLLTSLSAPASAVGVVSQLANDGYWQIHWQDARKYFFAKDELNATLYNLQDDVDFQSVLNGFQQMAGHGGPGIWTVADYYNYEKIHGKPARITAAALASGAPVFSGHLTTGQVNQLNAGVAPSTVITPVTMNAANQIWAVQQAAAAKAGQAAAIPQQKGGIITSAQSFLPNNPALPLISGAIDWFKGTTAAIANALPNPVQNIGTSGRGTIDTQNRGGVITVNPSPITQPVSTGSNAASPGSTANVAGSGAAGTIPAIATDVVAGAVNTLNTVASSVLPSSVATFISNNLLLSLAIAGGAAWMLFSHGSKGHRG